LYSLCAHFDFLVVAPDVGVPHFAVEFDGDAWHKTRAGRENDRKKDAICRMLNFPLLRVDRGYFRRLADGRQSLLEWLADLPGSVPSVEMAASYVPPSS
jgi:hypothetical protein